MHPLLEGCLCFTGWILSNASRSRSCSCLRAQFQVGLLQNTCAVPAPEAPSPTGWAPRYLALGAKHPESVMKLVFQMRPSGPPGQHPGWSSPCRPTHSAAPSLGGRRQCSHEGRGRGGQKRIGQAEGGMEAAAQPASPPPPRGPAHWCPWSRTGCPAAAQRCPLPRGPWLGPR